MRQQRGFAIISAIFLVIMLGTIALALFAISSSMHQSAALQVREANALNAARAGIQYAAYTEITGGVDGAACNSTTSLNLNGFTVAVTCSGTQHTVRGQEQDVYQLNAVATAGSWGQLGYVRRSVQTVVAVH